MLRRTAFVLFPECVAKGSCFCLGRDRVRSDFGIVAAHDRARPLPFVLCPMCCALRIGLEGGRLGGAFWRCAVGIAGESVVWEALCRCDWLDVA